MSTLFLPLVDWGMGTFLIGIFALVCVILIAVVYSLSQSKESIKTPDEDETLPKDF
jgi:Na+-translocating ferredoxin:NAD+ oxidoreductase RnfG subunit